MARSSLYFVAAVLAATGAHAQPAGYCSSVSKTLASAGQQSAATAFCSSYLSIPVSTVTTVHTATVTGSAIVDDVTTTITKITATKTTTQIVTVSSGISSTTAISCPTSSAGKVKRAGVSRPSALKAYSSGAQLSSACKCLSVSPSTPTITSVVTATSTPLTTQTTTVSVGRKTTVTKETTVTVLSSTTIIPAATLATSCANYVSNPGFEDVDDESVWSLAGDIEIDSNSNVNGYTTPYGNEMLNAWGEYSETSPSTASQLLSLPVDQTLTWSYAHNVHSTTYYLNVCHLSLSYGSQVLDSLSISGAATATWTQRNGTFQPLEDSGKFTVSTNCTGWKYPSGSMAISIDDIVISS